MTETVFDDDNVASKEAQSNNQQNADKGSDQNGGPSQEEIQKKLKSLSHAQEHIVKLESETAAYRDEIKELREQLEKASTIEDLLARREGSGAERSTAVDVNELANKVKDEVFQGLSQREREQKEASNLNQALESVMKVHGDKYKEVVREKASALGMTTKQMEDMAKSSPSAFSQLVLGGQPGNRAPQPTSSSSTSNVAPSLSGEQLSSEYFMKVRRENRALWNTSEFQKRYRQFLVDNVINKK